jgi:hypothetical protein
MSNHLARALRRRLTDAERLLWRICGTKSWAAGNLSGNIRSGLLLLILFVWKKTWSSKSMAGSMPKMKHLTGSGRRT